MAHNILIMLAICAGLFLLMLLFHLLMTGGRR